MTPTCTAAFFRDITANKDSFELTEGMIVDPARLPSKATIRVDAQNVASVVMRLSGPVSYSKVEIAPPWVLMGDNIAVNFPPGIYLLICTPIDSAGTLGELFTRKFSVGKGPIVIDPPPDTSWPSWIPQLPAIAPPSTAGMVQEAVPAGRDLSSCTASGHKYLLNGAYTVNGTGISLSGHDIAFMGAAGTKVALNAPDPGKNPDGSQKGNFAKLWSIQASAQRILFSDIEFIGNKFAQAAIAARGADITLRNCPVTTLQLVQGQGCNGLLIDACNSPNVLPGYWVVLAENNPTNRNTVIQKCKTVGSLGAHMTRLWDTDGVWIVDCDLLNPETIVRPAGYVHGASLNFRSGKNFYVVRGNFDAAEQTFGPLEIASQATKYVSNVLIAGAKFKNAQFQLCSGMSGLHIRDSVIDGGPASFVFQLRKVYAGKPMATDIQIDSTKIVGKQLLSNQSSIKAETLMKFTNSSFNGAPITKTPSGW